MKNVWKIWIVLFLLVALLVIAGCGHDDREFLPDITVPLEDGSAEIVIKEWRWLLGSGTEIYYRKDGKMTLLGKTTGGDDGYCPFEAGKYTLNVEEKELIIRWAFRGGDPEAKWKESYFTLPK